MSTKTLNAVVLYKNEMRNIISATIERSKAGNCTAEVVIRPLDRAQEWATGDGFAGGGGYDKETHSLVAALKKAGIPYAVLPAGGSSERIIESAVRHLGARGKLIIV